MREPQFNTISMNENPAEDQPDGFAYAIDLVGLPKIFNWTERDHRLAAITHQIVPLLVEALNAHSLGAIEGKSIDDLPSREQWRLHEEASSLVMRQNSYQRDHAIRSATITARRWMESFAKAALTLAEVEGTRELAIAAKVLGSFIEALLSAIPDTNLVKEILAAYEHALRDPLPGGRR